MFWVRLFLDPDQKLPGLVCAQTKNTVFCSSLHASKNVAFYGRIYTEYLHKMASADKWICSTCWMGGLGLQEYLLVTDNFCNYFFLFNFANNDITPQLKITLSGVMCKTDTASLNL